MLSCKPLHLVVITALCTLLSIASCENEDIFIDCSKCYETEPQEMNITMKFTINDENPVVNFTLYVGSFESGEPIFYGTTASSENSLRVEVGCYYTVVAEYCSQGRSIMAVDGKKFYFEHNTSDCSVECYLAKGSEFDVRLKY